MLEEGLIEEAYIEAMFQTVREFGSYIVIAPDVAMPPARPDKTVHEAGFAVLRLDEAGVFWRAGGQQGKTYHSDRLYRRGLSFRDDSRTG